MKKEFNALLLGLFVAGHVISMAQSFNVKRSDYVQSEYSFTAPSANLQEVQADGKTFVALSFEGSGPSSHLGRPNVPVITEMIEIPICSHVAVAVSNMKTKTLGKLEHPVMPVQPAPCKSDKNPLKFIIDSAYYEMDGFGDGPLAWVDKMGIARDKNVALLRVSPILYNPATGDIEIVTSMDVTLTFESADVAATQDLHRRHYSPDFSLGHQLLSTLPAEKEIRQDAPLHYLIVAHSSFRGHLDDFINWKKRQGFVVTVGYTDEAAVGTTSSSIAAYTKSFYDNASDALPAPTYLLLVGDHQQIPAFNARVTSPSSNHVTDLYFATWTDGDNIPDCYMGRFSARTVEELTPQIEKTLLYEGYNFDDDSYLGKGILIAGVDYGRPTDNAYSYADPAMDYFAKYYVSAANGFSDVRYYKNNTAFAPTGVTVTGSSQTTASEAALRALYSDGYGWINYSAHGFDESWSSPGFTANDVAAMTNNGKPSIMIGNCCLTGRFNTTSYDACFGEALLRKSNNAGAVAYFGCTNSSYWPQDFCWGVGVRTNISNSMDATYDAQNLGVYDRLFHTHNEPHSAWHVTAGSINVAGNAAVQAYGGGYVQYYWEIYELFGDPSLMPWLGTAETMSVSLEEVVPVGTGNYTVQAVPYAYVALTYGEEHDFVAATYADASGMATLSLPTEMVPGSYELAVWAQNYRPHFRNISVIVPNGPYVLVTDVVPTNGVLRPGELSSFDVSITNVGNAVSSQGVVSVSSENHQLSVVQSTSRYADCHPGDTVTLMGVNAVYLSDQLSDGDKVRLDFSVSFGGDAPSTKSAVLNVVSSKLEAGNISVSPLLAANASSTLACTVTNIGADTASNITFSLISRFGLLTSEAADQTVASLAPGESVSLSFDVAMGADVPNADIPFYLYVADDGGSRLLRAYSVRCGSQNVDDFESGTLAQFDWQQGNNPWEVTTAQSNSGMYSARSKTGLGNSSSSKMSITWTSASDDSIRFSYKVSSEDGYDVFKFDIDGSNKLEASGEEGWATVSYPVSAGTHQFNFTYSKDASVGRGSDCAWIDDVELPFSGDRCVFTVDTVCQGVEYMFAGQAINTDAMGTFAFVDSTSSVRQYLSLVVMEEPIVSIEVIRVGRCNVLKASGAETYEWSTGETGSHIVVCPTETTQVSVTGYRGGCSSTASVGLLGVEQSNHQKDVRLYPNPVETRVNIVANNIRSVELLNLMGMPIMQRKQVGGDSVSMDVHHLPSGIYFVKVETDCGVVVKKLIRR